MVHDALEGVGVVVLAGIHADQAGSNVGAVIRDALCIVQHIQEHDTRINGAHAVLQAQDVLVAQALRHHIDHLFQRFHLSRQAHIAVFKGIVGQVQDAVQRILQQLQLLGGAFTEGRFLFLQFFCLFHNVHRIVADALELGNKIQQFGHSVALIVAQLLIGHLDQIVGDCHLHAVDQVFTHPDGADGILVHLQQQRCSQIHIAGSTAGHLDHSALSLLQGHSRAFEQTFIQHRHAQLLCFLGAVRHSEQCQLGQHAAAGQEQQHGAHAGKGVDVCDGALVHHIVPHGDANGKLHRIHQRQQDHAANDVEVQMDQCSALAVLGGAANGEQRRKGRADVCAQNNGDGRAEGDQTRAGQCLQDTHRCRGGLDDHRDHHAHQNAQNGIRHGNEQILEHGALTQRSHTGVHQAHAGKQDAEAQHDLADVLPFSAAQEHIKNAANKCHHGRKGLGLDQCQPETVTGDIRHADQLAGNSGTNVCTHNDTYRLRKGHDAGVYQTDTNNDRAGRGLDDTRDEGAKNNALER